MSSLKDAAKKRRGFSTAPEGKNRPGSLTLAYIETEHVVLLPKGLAEAGNGSMYSNRRLLSDCLFAYAEPIRWMEGGASQPTND